MAIPHPCWVLTVLSLSLVKLKYFIALMLFRLKPAGLIFFFFDISPQEGGKTCLPEDRLIVRSLNRP